MSRERDQQHGPSEEKKPKATKRAKVEDLPEAPLADEDLRRVQGGAVPSEHLSWDEYEHS